MPAGGLAIRLTIHDARFVLSRPNRITRTADIDGLFASGRPLHHPLISLRAAPNGLDLPRVGIVCGKKLGGAVVRNRARRRLRAALRTLLPSLPAGWDILLTIRPPGANATVAEFICALEELVRRRGLASGAQ